MSGHPPGAPDAERRLSDAAPDAGRHYAIVAAAAAFVAFLPSLAAGYVYDDVALISANRYAHELVYLFRGFGTHLWDVDANGTAFQGLRYYRPLVSASYVLAWVTGGGAAWVFHLGNVLAHALATFLAARIASRWTGSPVLGLVAALVFALHPTRTESVIWIAGRTDVLMTLLMFAAVELAHESARRSGLARGTLVAGVVATAALAILSKEAGALTAALLGVDWLLLEPGTPARRRLGRVTLLVAGLGAAYLLVRAAAYPLRPGASLRPTLDHGLFTVWAYVERVVLPWPQTFFYRPIASLPGDLPLPSTVPGALVVAGASLLLGRAWRRDRVAFVLLVASVLLMAPLLHFSASGITSTTYDHFLYLPLWLAVTGAFRLHAAPLLRVAEQRVARIALAGILAVWGGVDALRVLDYRSEQAFWEHELAENPDNPVALQSVAGLSTKDGDLVRARDLMRRVLSPAAQRFVMLTSDRGGPVAARARLIDLEAALVADGDATSLERLHAELDGILAAALARAGMPLRAALGSDAFLASTAAAVSLLGTRTGHVARADELARALPDEMLFRVGNPMNLVLAMARLGDFRRARRLVALSRNPPPGLAPIGTTESVAELAGRLERAERRMRAAMRAGEAGRVDLAMALAELGAYLQALRVLRPAFVQQPHSADVDPLYVQLLLSARLEKEALATATAALGPERGLRALEELRASLPPRLLSIRPPAEPSPWAAAR